MRAKLFAGALLLVPTVAEAEVVTLRCSEHKPKNEAIEFSVALDTAARRVMDLGYGDGVETTEFSETSISAKHKLSIGPMIVDLMLDRVSGRFDLKWLVFDKGGKLDSKTTKMFEGTCEAMRRKF